MKRDRRGRPPSGLEKLTKRVGFLATKDQLAWLDQAWQRAGETSLPEWIRKVVVAEGERILDRSYPVPKRRK